MYLYTADKEISQFKAANYDIGAQFDLYQIKNIC